MTQIAAEFAQEVFLQELNGTESVEIELADLQLPQARLRGGVTDSHVRVLAEAVDRWPPIVISRSNREIIDGLHRYHAAQLLDRKSIGCVFFDGDIEDAFIESVRRNVVHGLPLTLRERKGAACRVLEFHAEWSDRRVGMICGLAATTVRSLRARATGDNKQLDKRQGIDGRMRPMNSREIRLRTARALRSHPKASLREIAQLVGTSPTTVRSVRAQLPTAGDSKSTEDNDSPKSVDLKRRILTPTSPNSSGDGIRADSPTSNDTISWSTDPAFVSTPSAAAFSKWFASTVIGEEWKDQVAAVPLSRIYEIADEARRRAAHWDKFSEALELRVRNTRR